MVVAVAGFWWLQWQSAPTTDGAAQTAVGDRHDDHDKR
jgi:hypothetical protein